MSNFNRYMTLIETTGLAGLLFGLSGFVLGVLNFARDRHKVVVTLQWDLVVTPGTEYDPDKKWGLSRVTNVGRRSTFISHVALRLPKGREWSHLMISEGIAGKKLSEGDPTALFVVSQDDMAPFSADWHRIVAQVSDATGKVWSSKRLNKVARPSWASLN
jgi:hypothetical protein